MKSSFQSIGNDIINNQGQYPKSFKNYGITENEITNQIEDDIINKLDNIKVNGESIPYQYKKDPPPKKKEDNNKEILNENKLKSKTPIQELEKEISKNNLEETLLLEQEKEYSIIDRRLIDELNQRCKILEKKLEGALKIYYQKEQIYINSEKIKKEYEDLLNQKSKDKTLLLAQKQNLENDVSNLTIALSNAKKEIIRLNEIKKNNIEKYNTIKEDLDTKLEEKKKNHISYESTITFLENQFYELIGENEKIVENNKKLGQIINDEKNEENVKLKKENHKLYFDIDRLKKIIKESQDEIVFLKKKIKEKTDNKFTMREIIKFKDKKNSFQDMNIKNLIKTVEEKNRGASWEKYSIALKNKQLEQIKKNHQQ